MYIYIYIYTYAVCVAYIYASVFCLRTGSLLYYVGLMSDNLCFYTVSCHNFKSQKFKLSVSNPKNKYVAYVSVLSRISNCQGLGRKHKFEILKTDRMVFQLLLNKSTPESHAIISTNSYYYNYYQSY